MQEVDRTFINYLNYGFVMGHFVLYVLYAPIISLIVYSLVLFIILTVIYFIQFIIGWRVWKNGLEIDLQNRLMGFFTIFNFGFYSVMPLLSLTFGSIFFWISLSIYLILLGFLFVKTKTVAEGIHDPKESKIGKAFIIGAILIVFIAIPARYNVPEGIVMSLLNHNQKEFYVFTALYLLGLLITFVLPVFFYPVQHKLEEPPKGRRKLSRAKRKALKEKRRKQI